MPSFRVDVCDRCSQRHEGEDLPARWVQIQVIEGVREDDNQMLGPELHDYVLCDRCSGDVLLRLREWAGETPRSN